MKFKGKELTRTICKNSLIRVWEQCTEDDKFDWYKLAHEWAVEEAKTLVKSGILDRDKTAIPKICGIIASLSPLKTWKQNLKLASQMARTNKSVGHTRLCNNKGLEVLKSYGSDESILEILNGNKISSFYLNIMYPNRINSITIDRHALSCLLGYWVTDDDYRGITKNQYEFFVQCFQWTAEKLNISPLLLQSATCVRWRKIKNNYKK